MPAKAPCDHFTPHLFLSNNRCRDCDFLESEHCTSVIEGRGRAPTLEQKVDSLVKDGCTHYTPHAWLVDRCRDCGRPESVHQTSAGSIVDEEEDAAPTKQKRAVKQAPIRNAQEIAALGSNSRRGSAVNTASSFKLRRGKKTTTANPTGDESAAADEDEGEGEEEGEGEGSLAHAQRVMDKAVAQMMLMDQELEEVKAQEAESLQAASISQLEYDKKMAAIQSAFEAKEAELKAEVEAAKAEIETSQAKMREEAEAEARAAGEAKDELARMREEADRAREEAAALRAEALAARSKAEEEREERERARQAELEERERTRQVEMEERERSRQAELDAARQEIANARQEADNARAEAAQQREEQERRERVAAEEREAALLEKRRQAEAEEVKEQDTQVTTAPAIIPTSNTTVNPTVDPTSAPPSTSESDATADREEEEAQPTAATPSEAAVGPYAGTVNLSDVLLKVEKLFLSGKNFFRFQYTKSGVVMSAVFLRVINDEYVLCWAKANSRTVKESRSLAFSDIQAIAVGKQSSVFTRAEFAQAPAGQCFSIIGGKHCLHLMAGNERDAEMTAFGLASLLKESRLTVNVFDHGQYREADGAVLTETQQEQGEDDDGAPLADITSVDQLITGSTTQRLTVSLAIKCSGLPLVHQNTLICLVDREEKTDRLVYISQTEKISKNPNPEFTREFTVDYEVGSVRELRFNVYDIAAKTQTIDDGDRLGSVKVDIKDVVEFDGVDFVYPLAHRDHNKNFKLIKAQSQLTVTCTRRDVVQHATPAYANQRLSIDTVQLAAMQSMLIKGDIFTFYAENAPSYPATVYYRCANAEAERTFALGQLHYSVHGQEGKDGALGVPLRSICDVYVGKKQRSFPQSAADDCCFSLLSKNGVRLDLEAKSKTQRDDYVNAITALLKHAAVESKKRAHAKLGTGRQF